MRKKCSQIFMIIMSVSVILAMSGCSVVKNTAKSLDNSGTEESSVDTEYLSSEDMFSDRDTKADYDAASASKIELSDSGIKTDCTSIRIDKSTITITAEGTYILSGNLSDGQLIIDAPDTAKVQLVLNGVQIANDSTAPIYVRESDKVFLTLPADSKNTLSVTGDYVDIDDNKIDAVVFSKSDLTINGIGALDITATYGHGIVSKDDLVICSSNISINAQKHAICGNDSVRISDGTFNLVSGKDGIHCENTDDATKGFVFISDGTFNIKSDGDGVDASYTTQINGGTIALMCGGGAANAPQKADDMFGGPGKAQNNTSLKTEDSTSTKGIKGTGSVVINGGTLTIDSADDSIHSNKNVEINGGSLTLTTGDDGIHADYNVLTTAGDINITKSYEGIEGLTIDINGGSINVQASDDGLNAAGGYDQSGFGGGNNPGMETTSGAYVKITGATLKINADGDGIDSNGELYVTGGNTVVEGPQNSGNGALDYGLTSQITGGTFIAIGASGMAQGFGDTSTQGAILWNISSTMSSGPITLKDSSGNEIISYTPTKSYNSVVLSCEGIKKGETYTLTAAGQTQTIEMTDINYGGAGDSMGGGMGGGQMKPDGGQMNPGGGKTKPDGGQMDPGGFKTRPEKMK